MEKYGTTMTLPRVICRTWSVCLRLKDDNHKNVSFSFSFSYLAKTYYPSHFFVHDVPMACRFYLDR